MRMKKTMSFSIVILMMKNKENKMNHKELRKKKINKSKEPTDY